MMTMQAPNISGWPTAPCRTTKPWLAFAGPVLGESDASSAAPWRLYLLIESFHLQEKRGTSWALRTCSSNGSIHILGRSFELSIILR
ncbi:hypothetical protein BJX64DRAFT_270454 [Aspergillus heterothallicus]